MGCRLIFQLSNLKNKNNLLLNLNLKKRLSNASNLFLNQTEWTSNKVREIFVNYFVNKQHDYVQSMPVINKIDKSILFVNSGMNQFKPIFLNDQDYLKKNNLNNLKKATNYQKCIRLSGKHNDFDEVGKNFRHHTFFEMLGNWSFNNSYFKEEACSMALDLLVNHFNLSLDKLIFTYFDGDQMLDLKPDLETKNIWLNLNVGQERIIGLGMKYNFWEMDKIGPCGICTEIYYILESEKATKLKENFSSLNAEKFKSLQLEVLNQSIEIWNLVFIQYYRNNLGILNKLNNCHVDTGMGLERLLSVLNQTNSNYNTDLFLPLIQIIEKEVSYENIPKYSFELDNKFDITYRIVADHVRAIVIMIADQCIPGNLEHGFCLRKLIRRVHFVLRNTFLQKNSKHLFKLLVNQVINNLKHAYPELNGKQENIIQTINQELDKYQKNIKDARSILKKFKKSNISGELEVKKAITIHKKYGLSKDAFYKLTSEYEIQIDWNEFDQFIENEKLKDVKDNNLSIT